MYPEYDAVVRWQKDGIQYSIVYHSHLDHVSLEAVAEYERLVNHLNGILDPWLCGYARFTPPVIVDRYEIDVYGGITFVEGDSETIVYRFDCNHVFDEARIECMSLEGLMQECERMGKQIQEYVPES